MNFFGEHLFLFLLRKCLRVELLSYPNRLSSLKAVKLLSKVCVSLLQLCQQGLRILLSPFFAVSL